MNPIVKYFNGEKAESYVFILIGVVAFAMALYFLMHLKTPFWKGVAIPFILVACLEFVVGYTIVTRTPSDLFRVENFMKQELQNIKNLEIPRMEQVVRNFLIFRYLELILIGIGIILMYSSIKETYWRGIGFGLFIQASIVLGLDFFAEKRGHIYLDYLQEIHSKK